MSGVVRLLSVAAAATLLSFPAAGQAGGPAAGLGWSPSTAGAFDFGAVTVGQSASQVFTLGSSKGAFAGLAVTLSGSGSFSLHSGRLLGREDDGGREEGHDLQGHG